MEKPEQHIDLVFKNKLAHASVPPPAFVWTNVEKELRRRKKPVFFWWWTSSLALLLVAGGAYFLQESGQSTGIVSSTSTQQFADHQSVAAAPNSQNKENGAVSLTESAVNSPENNAEQGKNLQPRKAGDASFAPFTKKSTAGSIGRNTDAKGGSLSAPEIMNEIVVNQLTPEASTTSTVTLPGLFPQTPTDVNTALPLLPGLKTDFFETKIVQPAGKRWPTKVAKKKKKNENCYDFASHRTVLMVDAYAGPETADRSFSTKNAENKPYLAKRQQTEGRGWGFNGGLRATAVFREHFTASAGIQYNQFTEVFSYVDPTSIEFDVHVKIDPTTGEATFDTSDIHFGERRVKTYNRYGFLDIPVALGYEVRQGRGGIRFQGGAALNLLFHKRGTILSPDTGKPVSFTPDKPGAIDVFTSNAGLSIQGSMQFFWSYEPRTRFFAEPYFRKILDPVTLDSHPVSARYDLWGARFGVTKIF